MMYGGCFLVLWGLVVCVWAWWLGLLACFDCGLVGVLCVNSVGIRYPEFIHICCLFAC